MCSGWGDPHYITFDGTYYTFLDNCTYVLVQQIVPVYGHFRVLVENYFCNSEDGLSCPQSIIVEYRENRVVLVRRPVHGVMTNEVGARQGGPASAGRAEGARRWLLTSAPLPSRSVPHGSLSRSSLMARW